MSRLIRICLLIKYSLLSWFILISLLHNVMRKFGTFFMGHPVLLYVVQCCSSVRSSIFRRPRGGVLLLQNVPDSRTDCCFRHFNRRSLSWRWRWLGRCSLAAVSVHQALHHVGDVSRQPCLVRSCRVYPASPVASGRQCRPVWYQITASFVDSETTCGTTTCRKFTVSPRSSMTATFSGSRRNQGAYAVTTTTTQLHPIAYLY